MWKVALISFLCVFLFAGIMAFQDMMNRFQRENALRESGNWFVATEKQSRLISEHAYFDGEGKMTTRSSAYHTTKSGEEAAGVIGTADRAFFQLSGFAPEEGRMPEKPDEVAVTRSGLSNLACSFAAGQEITLAYDTGEQTTDGRPVLRFKRVTVTGILPSYRKNWIDEIEFPDFFMTESGLESLDVTEDGETYYFYSLERGHMDVAAGRLFSALEDAHMKQGEYDLLIYNSASYDVTMWGSEDMYGLAMVFCAILGGMSLVYLFSGCLYDRRSIYFRYLELGLSRRQLRAMIAVEWTVVFIPLACAALCTAFAVAGIGAGILSKKYGISNIFYLSGHTLCMTFFFTFGVFLLVLLWCCLGFRAKNLHEMSGKLPVRKLKRLHRDRDARYTGMALFQKRRGRLYPGRSVVKILFMAASFSIVLYMSVLWEARYRENAAVRGRADIEGRDWMECGGTEGGNGYIIDQDGRLTSGTILMDKTLSQREKEERIHEIIPYTGRSEEPTTLWSGMPKEERKKFEDIPGVRRVAGETAAWDMKLWWRDAWHSHFRNNIFIKEELEGLYTGILKSERDIAALGENPVVEGEYDKAYTVIPKDVSMYQYDIYGLEKSEETDRALRASGSGYDSDAFWAGEQCVLFALSLEDIAGWEHEETGDGEQDTLQGVLLYDEEREEYRFQGREGSKYQYSFSENTIHSGESIQILDSEKKELLSARVVVGTDAKCCRNIQKSVPQMDLEDSAYEDFLLENNGGYQLFCSENMMKKLAEKVDKPLTYHRLNIWLKEGAGRKKAEKCVTDILSKNDWEYTSNLEKKNTVKKALDRQRMISAAVILLVAGCYFFLMINMERREMEQIRGQIQLFLQQGMWKRDILKARVQYHLREYLWVLLSVPLCCVWQGIGRVSALVREAKEDRYSALDMVSMVREVLADWSHSLTDVWLWGIFFLSATAAVLAVVSAERRYMKKLKLFAVQRHCD